MARRANPGRGWSDDDDDEEEFPDIFGLAHNKKAQSRPNRSSAKPELKEFPDIFGLSHKKRAESRQDGSAVRPAELQVHPGTELPARPAAAVRRRKLGPLSDNVLLKAWTAESVKEVKPLCREKENREPRRTRAKLLSPKDQEDEYVSAKEDVDVESTSLFDDTFHSCVSESNKFNESEYQEDGSGADDDDDDDFSTDPYPRGAPEKPCFETMNRRKPSRRAAMDATSTAGYLAIDMKGASKLAQQNTAPDLNIDNKSSRRRVAQGKVNKAGNSNLADALSRLRLGDASELLPKLDMSLPTEKGVTPPSSPTKSQTGLVSPTKLPRIPATPHRPSSDMFWSQEFVDDWNDQHSPRKQLFPNAIEAKRRSRASASPEKTAQSGACTGAASQREQKKAFEKTKHEIAENFLKELDNVITGGKLAELTASTGGIKIIWSNKLKTTAGRAHWKCETTRTGVPDGTTITSNHRAWVELSDKVVDNEHRLLNTLAHEFCHAATYMISGVTKNPHGPEFKAWGDKCSRAFADRGIVVTTKHSYEIDFKYVWECVDCGYEHKRHSKSIDPARHRCGKCRSELRQVKPVPRAKQEGDGPRKVSEYQVFMKEQMRLIRAENPKTPQKDIMKIVASRWAAQRSKSSTPAPDDSAEEVAKGLSGLVVGGKRYECVDLTE